MDCAEIEASNSDGKITKEEATQAVIERREEFVW